MCDISVAGEGKCRVCETSLRRMSASISRGAGTQGSLELELAGLHSIRVQFGRLGNYNAIFS